MATTKTEKVASVGEDVERSDPSCTIAGNVKWCICAKGVTVLQKLKSRITVSFINYTSGHISEGIESAVSKREIRTPVFMAAFFSMGGG